MNNDDDMPIAEARLTRSKGGSWRWVISCPWCGQEHVHNGGTADEDPLSHLKPHIPHCSRQFKEQHPTSPYRLVDANPYETRRLLALQAARDA